MTRFDRLLVRGAFLTGAGAVVVALLVLAPVFARDLGWLGIPDHVLHTVGHLTVYGAIAVGVALGLGGHYGFAWLLTMAVAGAEELHQAYVPGRCVDLSDYLLNAVSITLAIAVFAVATRPWAQTTASPAAAGAAAK